MLQVKQKMKLSTALADTPEPTPAYLYEEFARSTFSSSSECTGLADGLISKLKYPSSTSAHVLYKALKMVKLISEKGSPDFKRIIQKHANVLRECAAFRGPSDSIYGDGYNQKVRDAAHAAIEAIYATPTVVSLLQSYGQRKGMDLSGMGYDATTHTRIEGNSSSSQQQQHHHSGSSSSYSSSRRAGSGGGGGSSSGGGYTAAAVSRRSEPYDHYAPPNRGGYSSAPVSGLRPSAATTGYHERTVSSSSSDTCSSGDGIVGGGGNAYRKTGTPTTTTPAAAGSNTRAYARDIPSGAQVTEAAPPPPPDAITTKRLVQVQKVIRKLTEECRTTIPEGPILKEFATNVAVVDDWATVAQQLVETAEKKHNWQIRLRALCGIEYLLANPPPNSGTIAQAFTPHTEGITSISQSAAQESLRARAKKVISLLPAESTRQPPPPPTSKVTKEVMFLEVVHTDELKQQQQEEEPSDALFSGMEIKSTAASVVKPSSSIQRGGGGGGGSTSVKAVPGSVPVPLSTAASKVPTSSSSSSTTASTTSANPADALAQFFLPPEEEKKGVGLPSQQKGDLFDELFPTATPTAPQSVLPSGNSAIISSSCYTSTAVRTKVSLQGNPNANTTPASNDPFSGLAAAAAAATATVATGPSLSSSSSSSSSSCSKPSLGSEVTSPGPGLFSGMAVKVPPSSASTAAAATTAAGSQQLLLDALLSATAPANPPPPVTSGGGKPTPKLQQEGVVDPSSDNSCSLLGMLSAVDSHQGTAATSTSSNDKASSFIHSNLKNLEKMNLSGTAAGTATGIGGGGSTSAAAAVPAYASLVANSGGSSRSAFSFI